MIIPVVYLSYSEGIPADSYADHTMLHDLFSGNLWSWANGHTFLERQTFEGVNPREGCIVVLPARFQAEFVGRLNGDIASFPWVILILTGDEESNFPVERVDHPNIRIWVMSPQFDRHSSYRKLGSGYFPSIRSDLAKNDGSKRIDWSFVGQVNNARRELCYSSLEAIQERIPGYLEKTDGFTLGLPPDQYATNLSDTRVAMCPSGSFTPDTFRLFEALEAGCIPLADNRVSGRDTGEDYWSWFFAPNPVPFPRIGDWESAYSYTESLLENYQTKANQVFSWWQARKRELAYWLREDIAELSGMTFEDHITVLMVTSPILAHPETSMIEKTISDVRTKLPEAEIIILIDGINPKQLEAHPEYASTYPEYIRRLLWKCNFEWHNVLPVVFPEHSHQVKMTREGLKLVTTPMVLFVEHDAPLTPDPEFTFPWDDLVQPFLSGEINVLRFHHESHILESSEPLMMGPVEKVNGVEMRKTMQWSQRPHLANTSFYRKMLDHYFSPDAVGMIEDHIHGVIIEDCQRDGLTGWANWRLYVYHPTDSPLGNIKRSYTTDGRGEESKYEDTFRY